jgi:N-acetylmuramate 1-kinase
MKTILEFNTQIETERYAEMLSLWAKPGLVIALTGDVGAGKSTFARAFIKALAKPEDAFDVPSPSFSLVQLYDNTRVAVAHVDLYRLSNAAQTEELGLSEFLTSHILLIEWPDRLAGKLAENTLMLNFTGKGEHRTVEMTAQGSWIEALQRNAAIEKFLSDSNWNNAARSFLEGDASSRRYEALEHKSKRMILMDMPQRPDGPPVKNGKPYSAIAHLAEGLSSVVNVNKQLTTFGYSAPLIEAKAINHGLAIIEDLGGLVYGRMMIDGSNMREPMMSAVALLADMSTKPWPKTINPYDVEAQLIEADLLVSWFWPYVNGTPAEQSLHESFEKIWRNILPLAVSEKPYWVMRDFHSPNLIWLPHRDGIKRVGLIDTQDAVLGHPAYDLASMLQDARVDIEFDWADELYKYYENLRHQQGSFDAEKFNAAYVILGAQRATKILGIFARLSKRDGKHGYLKHMPRVSRYLARNLEHPDLVDLKTWYKKNMPEALAVGKS